MVGKRPVLRVEMSVASSVPGRKESKSSPVSYPPCVLTWPPFFDGELTEMWKGNEKKHQSHRVSQVANGTIQIT